MGTVVMLGSNDISAYVRSCDIVLGMMDAFQHVADVGTCTLVVNNEDRRFSPAYTSGAYYGLLLPYMDVTVERNSVRLFTGFVESFMPESGRYGGQTCTIRCIDMAGVLQADKMGIPLQEGQNSGFLLKLITSTVRRSARATGTITISDTVSANDTVTIGSTVYTFKASPSAAYEVKAGAPAAAATNLAAAIDAAGAEFAEDVYGADTYRHSQVTAEPEVLAGEAGGSTDIEPVYLGASAIGKPSDGIEYQGSQCFQVATGTLLELEFYIKSKTGTPGTLTWEVCADASGVPGEVLQSGTFTPTVDAWTTVAVSGGVSLYSGTNYWAKLRITTVPAANNCWRWQYGNSVVAQPSADKAGSGSWVVFWEYDYSVRITTGVVADCYVHLTANARGAWGNTVALSDTGANIAVSAATLEGGADGPAGLIDFDDGIMTVNTAGEAWSESTTNAMTAIRDVVETEFGYFWCARDGTLTFRDQQYIFERANATPTMTINNQHNIQDAGLSIDDVINRVVVSYKPRGSLTEGVIARSQATLSVPGRWGAGIGSTNYTRWNASQEKTQAEGSRTFTLPFVDVVAGRLVGARRLSLPLVAGTDYTVNDFEDESGWDYTYGGRVKFSVADTGSGVEVHATNTALGTLYVFGLQVRGIGIIDYDPLEIVIEDGTSQDDYGRRSYDYFIPLEIDGGDVFADTLARYLLGRYKTPAHRVFVAGFEGPQEVGATSVFDVDIGDVVSITETQTGIAAWKAWVIGLEYSIEAEDVTRVAFYLSPVDDVTYWLLEEAGFSELGDTTRLAL